MTPIPRDGPCEPYCDLWRDLEEKASSSISLVVGSL